MTSHHPATIRYVIGVDGGGMGTHARLTRAEGQVLGLAEAGPSALGQRIEQAWNNVSQAIERSFQSTKVDAWKPEECALGLGLAGAIGAKQNRDFMRQARRFGNIELASDGYPTLLGAHGGRPGAIVAAGTGSTGEAEPPRDAEADIVTELLASQGCSLPRSVGFRSKPCVIL